MRADMANEFCYRLPDEPAAGTEIVDDAEASRTTAPGSGAWQVDLTLTAAGIDAFNDIAARCYRRDATCPLGQVALVVDDEVVFAPTIQEPSFERGQIVVSGDFAEDEARDLARALAG
jgi:preprotein translocase subunit SecD